MAGNSPVVSVIMPAYNAARYISAAVESILAQTFGDFELLIVDDGSTDRTPALLAHFAERDERVEVIDQEHAGYVRALNLMLDRARGELVARMDADDIAHPGRLRQQVEFLSTRPEVVCVGSAFDIIDDLVTRKGMGLILISHDLNLVSRYCDRILVMNAGRVVEECAAGELDKARHPYTRGLLAAMPTIDESRDELPVLDRTQWAGT